MSRRDRDVVVHRSKEALNFINRYELACCPDVYETIYNFISRSSEHLVKSVSALVKDNNVTDETIIALSDRTERAEYMMKLPAIVDAVVSSISEMSEGIQDTQDKFASVKGEITKKSQMLSGEDLTSLAAQLVEASDHYSSQLSKGSSHFADHAGEVSLLKEELKRKEAQLETDALTGVGTRLFMERKFNDISHNTDRLNSGISVVVADIDNFKLLNDNHGHKIGDQVLRYVAQNLAKLTGEAPYSVTRYGGEEFILVFDDYPLDAVYDVVDRLREDLAQKRVKRKDTKRELGEITASFGVAHISAYEVHNGSAPLVLDDLIHRADTAMYRAKRTGKNKVMVAPSASEDIGIDVDDEVDLTA